MLLLHRKRIGVFYRTDSLLSILYVNFRKYSIPKCKTARCYRHQTASHRFATKRLRNELSLLTAVLNKYRGDINFKNIDLPVLLAMWLSFSMRKVRGLTKSKSISGDYLTIKGVIVDVRKEAITKEMGKNPARNRRHRIPPYI